MKTYVLMVSKQFPKTHKRVGESTGFVENIQFLLTPACEKLHTIRSNYEFWKYRSKVINEGKAILSIRYWSGLPYKSTQIEICQLTKIEVEKLSNLDNFVYAEIEGEQINWELVAKNDGLSFIDFCEWFKVRNSEPMAVIHFTEFRYGR